MRTIGRLNQNNWLSSDDEENQEQTEIKIFCFKWDTKSIKDKGLHPKIVIYGTIVGVIFLLSLTVFVFGYGTGWHPLVFPSQTASSIMTSCKMVYDLGHSQEATNASPSFLFSLYNGVGFLVGAVGVVSSIIVKTPFDNATVFLGSIYPSAIIMFYIMTLISDHKSIPSWLPKREDPIVPARRFQSKEQLELQRRKNWWKIYVKTAWIAFVTATMLADIASDIYYGAELILLYRKVDLFLFLSGIAMVACCAADFGIMCLMLLFPGWVSYSAHVMAFLMELPNLILTGLSIWKRQQLAQEIERTNVRDREEGNWGLAVFSLVTTLLSVLIHMAYVMDRWAVQSAINTIQSM
eukprot:TRINITY_DN4824_c0_g1_i1.p1 TRINITY_DN4824_c0_g1~~TRINITY_DN4824_c0_g1_i1.p1  ORF type:complete len:351 (-),score=24.25 TRINITY_DN4824_c0_g1_i1:459-1511(-)